jgi:hypothetical protein
MVQRREFVNTGKSFGHHTNFDPGKPKHLLASTGSNRDEVRRFVSCTAHSWHEGEHSPTPLDLNNITSSPCKRNSATILPPSNDKWTWQFQNSPLSATQTDREIPPSAIAGSSTSRPFWLPARPRASHVSETHIFDILSCMSSFLYAGLSPRASLSVVCVGSSMIFCVRSILYCLSTAWMSRYITRA